MTFSTRREGILFHEVDDELVLYDQEDEKLYRLNQTSAAVWRQCDGQTQVDQMLEVLNNELEQPVEQDVVHLALSQFEEAGLLSSTSPSASTLKISRRRLVKMMGMGAASLLLPVVQQLATGDLTPTAYAGTTTHGPPSTTTTTSTPGTTTTTSAPGTTTTTTGAPGTTTTTTAGPPGTTTTSAPQASTTTPAPATTPPPEPGILDQGPTSPPTGPTNPFFIPASTPGSSSALDLVFMAGDANSIRLAIRNLILLADLSVFEKRILLQSGLTLGRQIQRLTALLLTSPGLLLIVDGLQRAWLALGPTVRNTMPPIGGSELP